VDEQKTVEAEETNPLWIGWKNTIKAVLKSVAKK
jgi:hypothetical protein